MMRNLFKDPEFRAEFHKLVSDEVSPLMPEELSKVIRQMPRDPEVVEMLKKFSRVDPLPSRLRKSQCKNAAEIIGVGQWCAKGYR